MYTVTINEFDSEERILRQDLSSEGHAFSVIHADAANRCEGDPDDFMEWGSFGMRCIFGGDILYTIKEIL